MTIVKNVPLKKFRKFLEFHNAKIIRSNGGHEIWSKSNCTRPIVIQTHVDPIPIIVLKSNLSTMGLTKQDLLNWLLQN
jgi:hypothetical protein